MGVGVLEVGRWGSSTVEITHRGKEALGSSRCSQNTARAGLGLLREQSLIAQVGILNRERLLKDSL